MSASSNNKAYKISRSDLIEAISALKFSAEQYSSGADGPWRNPKVPAALRKHATHCKAVAQRIRKALR